jgi:hypothetical protein
MYKWRNKEVDSAQQIITKLVVIYPIDPVPAKIASAALFSRHMVPANA